MKKNNLFKKSMSVLLSLMMVFGLFVPVSAADETVSGDMIRLEDGYAISTGLLEPELYDSNSYSQDFAGLETLVDIDEFSDYLVQSFYSCPKTVNISQFQIPYTSENASAIARLMWHELPELFQISSVGYYIGASDTIVSVYCSEYYYTVDEYHQMYEQAEKAANEMVADLIGSDLSDVEKALLIHDRIVGFCEYDYDNLLAGDIPRTSRNIYGVLVLGDAVCQGYALAYEYLLKKVGIEAHYMSSDLLNHAWNNVCIDGAWYYVDTTWDDPVWDVNGRVEHEDFLQSYEKFSVSHSINGETDYEVLEPANCTYDDFYWQDVNAGFQYLDGNYYYIANNALKKTSDLLDSSKSETLIDFGRWTINSSGTYYSNNYSKLSSDGENLLYSLQDGVYRYNIKTGTSEAVWKPTAPEGMSNPCVYGFNYDGTYLVCVFNSSPSFSADTKKLYTQKRLYDKKAPYGEITSTNDVTDSQTLTLTLWDNVEVDGYYWGTNANYRENTYFEVTAESVEKTVSQEGTYYLTVKDTSGNISQTVSITMLKTTLDAKGGSVTPAYVLTQMGNSFALPNAERNGYNHLGWEAGGKTYEAGESYTPEVNASLTAKWSCKHEKYYSKVTLAATCTKEGVMTYTCTTCSYSYTVSIEKLPHTEVTDAKVEATCSKTGLTEGSHCSVCGKVLVAQQTVPTTEHSYSGKVTTEATCTKEGVMTYTCTACGDSYTASIAKLPHTEVTDAKVEATCFETGLTEGSHCSACGKVLVAQQTVPVKQHAYETVHTIPATCTSEGENTSVCAVCGNSKTEKIPLAKHSDGDGNGICDECGLVLENPIENCSCMCHKTGISSFIYKIVRFFWKIFGTNKTCACGQVHY
ncbi:MAG: transglutaminase domain-containing protein [Acutalibacteraceae bacterium]